MGRLLDVPNGYGRFMLLAAAAGLAIYAACDTAPGPQAVEGPRVTGDRVPAITITEPTENLSLSQASTFTISWTDEDRDSAAAISFSLVNTDPGASPMTVALVEGILENDTVAPDTVTVSAAFVPRGSYYLQATISDGVNAPVTEFATTDPPAQARIVITVGEEGAVPSNLPPSLFVPRPQFNLSVTLDDTITIVVQPTSDTPNVNSPYDADSDTLLYFSLDLDDDPRTGDPLNPDPDQLLLLRDAPDGIPLGAWEPLEYDIPVDLSRFPYREDGKPYFVRVTIDDGIDAPRDAYAPGTINVTRAAVGSLVSGRIDLGQMGRTYTGATWLGFNPGARLGHAMTSVVDFDADGVGDCMLAAQFGTPTGMEPIGEAYLIYGHDGLRFGGRSNVNTVGRGLLEGLTYTGPAVDGATFMGPRPRPPESDGETKGIVSVGYVPDLTGDGRPELLFGCPYIDGVRQHRDDDPEDLREGTSDNMVAIVRQRGLEVFRANGDGEPLDDEDPETSLLAYDGAVDTYIDASNPNTAYGNELELTWSSDEIDDQVTPTRWALIQFDDLNQTIPDFARFDKDEIEIVSATLSVNVYGRGDDADVHALLREIDMNTTYNNWVTVSGDPDADPGPLEDVDYDPDSVGSFTEIVTGPANPADVTETVEDIFENRQDIYGWIIIPTDVRPVTFASGEVNFVDIRPVLRIHYRREVQGGGANDGCYPDFLPNNSSNNPPAQGSEDDVIATRINLERQGMVALVNSENRDAEGPSDLIRLNRATVSIDLAGQRPVTDLGHAHAVPSMGAVGPSGRLEGARFQAGMYDTIDAFSLNQGPIRAEWGTRVGFLPDIGNDQVPEVIISAPRNEQDIEDLIAEMRTLYPGLPEEEITHLTSRRRNTRANIVVFHGENFNLLREKSPGCSTLPYFSQADPGRCSDPPNNRSLEGAEYETLAIKGEKASDLFGDGSHAGDFNLDGSPDILCGASFADGPTGEDVGATYIVYQRQQNTQVVIEVADANDPSKRPPMLRIRGDLPNDRIGWAQEGVLDINGDRINDVALSSPYADAGLVPSDGCSLDFNESGSLDGEDQAAFSACRAEFGDADLSSTDECAFFDYNNDRRVDELDADVFSGGDCPVDNGVVAVVFGGIMLDGDRVVSQIAGADLPGVLFYGTEAGDRAGHDIASAGDFNRDGFGDLLITAPGATTTDDDGRTRVGVVYLVFGGTHLNNRKFDLSLVGSQDLPGLVLMSPFVTPEDQLTANEAPPQYVAGLGDLNNDGFDDIGIGNPLADFVDDLLPQVPGSPGDDLTTGRRRDAGEIYMIYGHNITGSNP